MRFLCATLAVGVADVEVNEAGFVVTTDELFGDKPVEASIARWDLRARFACRITAGDTHLASTAADVRSFGRVLQRRLEEVGGGCHDGGAG